MKNTNSITHSITNSIAYNAYIASCKEQKKGSVCLKIAEKILKGFRLDYSSKKIARKMNESGIFTIMGKAWTANSIQMQALKMCRFDEDSSLAWAFAEMIRKGEATQADIDLLEARTRTRH